MAAALALGLEPDAKGSVTFLQMQLRAGWLGEVKGLKHTKSWGYRGGRGLHLHWNVPFLPTFSRDKRSRMVTTTDNTKA